VKRVLLAHPRMRRPCGDRLTNVEADQARVVRNGREQRQRDKDSTVTHHYEYCNNVSVLAA